MRRLAALAAMACGAVLAAPLARADELVLRWSEAAPARPVFRGVLNKDAAGMNAGGMLYQAPNAAGLLAAVLAHALVSSTAQSAEMRKLQARADEVLQPYSASLDALASDDLLAQTRAALGTQGLAVRPGWVNPNLELTPVFLVTQDRRAVMLDLAAHFHDGSGARPRPMGVRVVSDPRGQLVEGQDDWATSPDGLRKVCVELLARAVRHLLDHADPSRSAPTALERTVRFQEGGALRMERSRVLEQRCGRALLLTLSDTLLSVPLAAGAPDAECTALAPPSAASAAGS